MDKPVRQHTISDSQLMALIMFENRIARLHRIAKQWGKGSHITCHLKTTSPSEMQTKGISHDTTLTAAIVDLRPFMLNDDKIYFPKICNTISTQHQDNKTITSNIKECKKFWQAYDINKQNTENSAKMQGCFDINGNQITTYKGLLKYYMYGKCVHADNEKLFNTMLTLENNGFHFAVAKAELQACIYTLEEFLYKFNKTYVKPILKQNAEKANALKDAF